MASSKSLQPLLQTTTLWRGSRPRPGHAFAFQVQRYLSQRPQRAGGFPYLVYRHLFERKELLRRLRFPREYVPIETKIWWTVKWTPRLLFELVSHGVRYPFWRMQYSWPPGKEGVVVKSRIGRFLYQFLMDNPEVHRLFNITVLLWGHFHFSEGHSMKPNLGHHPGILYSSYAYVYSHDLKLGDVVVVIPLDFDPKTKSGGLVKRIAGLEGHRLSVTTGIYRSQYLLPVQLILFLWSRPERISLIAYTAKDRTLLRSWR